MTDDQPAVAADAPARASRRRNPVVSRDRILRAAQAEFAAHGFAGARIERIVKRAGSNPRMVYHYFGSKSDLYVAVLEDALGDLRAAELHLDVDDLDPVEGLLQLFDFMNGHFEANQHLVSLLTNENLQKARLMRKSTRIREMSSPVLAMIGRLVARGRAAGRLPKDIDPLRFYVLMVALSQFHLSNVHTLSAIFDQDLTSADWRARRRADARRMLERYLNVGAGQAPNGADSGA